MNRPSREPTPNVRFLALGDSYTIGEAVDPTERWPVLLAELLRERGVAIQDPEITARTGWTTDELSAALAHTPADAAFDLVTLLIGVNNQFRGRSSDEYRSQFRDLLTCAIGHAFRGASHVIVLSIPDWSVTPFAEGRDRAKIAVEIDQFNAIARDEAARSGVRYIDITPISRRAGGEPELLAHDGLHPSGAMYSEWARAVLSAALEALT